MAALKGGSRLPPTVLIDRGAEAPGFDTVRADCFAGGYAAARHLIDLGHRDIAVLTHSKRLDNIEQRIAGCRRALSEAALNGRDRVIYAGHDLESLRGAIELELNRADRPTAIFALTNVCALASIKGARGLGLEIPGDVSIVGFDDFDWMSALSPYLTTVAQPVDDFASTAWRLLTQRPQGRWGERHRADRASLHAQGAGIDRASPPAAQGRRRREGRAAWGATSMIRLGTPLSLWTSAPTQEGAAGQPRRATQALRKASSDKAFLQERRRN